MQSIDLASNRVIAINDRGRSYKLVVAPIAQKKWLRYFDGCVSASEYADGARIDSNDFSAARRELAESVLIDAEGYTTSQPLHEIEAWQTKLPASHLLTLGATLCAVSVSDDLDDAPIQIGRETVILEATWNANDSGEMRRLRGLRHVFESPSGDQQRRYSRDASRSRVVGGSRSGRTIWLGAQATLMDLYDELVVEVDGYSLSGKPIVDRDEIAEVMDGFHKVVAAAALFSPAPLKVAEVKEGDE